MIIRYANKEWPITTNRDGPEFDHSGKFDDRVINPSILFRQIDSKVTSSFLFKRRAGIFIHSYKQAWKVLTTSENWVKNKFPKKLTRLVQVFKWKTNNLVAPGKRESSYGRCCERNNICYKNLARRIEENDREDARSRRQRVGTRVHTVRRHFRWVEKVSVLAVVKNSYVSLKDSIYLQKNKKGKCCILYKSNEIYHKPWRHLSPLKKNDGPIRREVWRSLSTAPPIRYGSFKFYCVWCVILITSPSPSLPLYISICIYGALCTHFRCMYRENGRKGI